MRLIVLAAAALMLAACSTTVERAPLSATAASFADAGFKVAEVTAKVNDGVASLDVGTDLASAVKAQLLTRPAGKIPANLRLTITDYKALSQLVRFGAGALVGSNVLEVSVEVVSPDGESIRTFKVRRSANQGGFGMFASAHQGLITTVAEAIAEELAKPAKS